MNRKTCYCINPLCKCVYGCGCTLADKSVGKCMCCIMEETNNKIDKLRRKKTTKNNCNCDLGNQKFYDIIVNHGNDKYYSVRYECLVTVKPKNGHTISYDYDGYIKASQNNEYEEIESLIYEKTIPSETTNFKGDTYYLLFVDRKNLMYGLYYSKSIDFLAPTQSN